VEDLIQHNPGPALDPIQDVTPTEADCLRADIYAAGDKLDKATQNKIEAAIQKAGDDLAKLQSILAHTHKTVTEKDTQP
jgi:hypothetical protein